MWEVHRTIRNNMSHNACFEEETLVNVRVIRCWIKLAKSTFYYARNLCSSCKREIEEMSGEASFADIDLRTIKTRLLVKKIQERFFGDGRTQKTHDEDPLGW